MRHRSTLRPGDTGLAARLRREMEGEVWFDPASRGRYSTDASIYQIEPIGVVAPRTAGDIAQAIAVCREAGAPVLPRGAGTSQCGQTVGEAVVVDTSKYLDRVIGFDAEAQRVTVQPASCSTASMHGSSRRDFSSPSMYHRPTGRPSGAWPATTRAAPAPSATATWCTTCTRSARSSPTGRRPGSPRRRAISQGSRAMTATAI